MKKNIVLVGGGGHCKACIDVIEQEDKYRIVGIVDIAERLHQQVLGYVIFATDREVPDLVKQYEHLLVTVGQITTPDVRIKLYDLLKKENADLPSIISPFSYVSPHANIGAGTIIMHHATINAGARIGNNCIINTKALVEHDALIGDHCHVSTGAVINGGAKVSSRSFIGSNAVVKQGVTLAENSFVRFHTRVVSDI